jgi:hypothetical protein
MDGFSVDQFNAQGTEFIAAWSALRGGWSDDLERQLTARRVDLVCFRHLTAGCWLRLTKDLALGVYAAMDGAHETELGRKIVCQCRMPHTPKGTLATPPLAFTPRHAGAIVGRFAADPLLVWHGATQQVRAAVKRDLGPLFAGVRSEQSWAVESKVCPPDADVFSAAIHLLGATHGVLATVNANFSAYVLQCAFGLPTEHNRASEDADFRNMLLRRARNHVNDVLIAIAGNPDADPPAADISTAPTGDLSPPALNGEKLRESTGVAPAGTSEKMPQKTAPLPACPACNGPRRAEDGDTADRLCAKCRSAKVSEYGTLLEAYATSPAKRRELSDWATMEHLGRRLAVLMSNGSEPFTFDPELDFLTAWLAGKYGGHRHSWYFAQRAEVVELLRDEVARLDGAPPAADTSTVRTKGKRTATDPVLSERAQEVLLAIQREEAFTSDGRVTTRVVANAVGGPKADRQQFTRAMRELKGLGLVDARVGRGGGVWLTVAGARRAGKL